LKTVTILRHFQKKVKNLQMEGRARARRGL
jgi:hypothetical protein